MSASFLSFTGVCIVLCLLQVGAALPWVLAWEYRLRPRLREPSFWGTLLLIGAGGGVVLALVLDAYSDPGVLAGAGRVYGSLLHLQLAADFFVAVFGVLLLLWPKGGAVALAAFREGIRQPLFWLLTLAFLTLMLLSPFIPYFTFGEDLKMVKELCYAFIMLAAALFAVFTASISVYEEIEGRTAITLMSKPVSRRQFFLGKFAGILLTSMAMTAFLAWFMAWIFLFKPYYDNPNPSPEERIPDPAWVLDAARSLVPAGEAFDLMRGFGLWMHDFGEILPGLVISFCQVMVLLAIATALATRVPMIVNLVVCLAFYFLGHLTPIMTEVAPRGLVKFVADVFDTILPGLDLFDVGTAIVREVPLPPGGFAWYTLNVSLYAVLYTAIALLFGLILFEDRDLA
jgi:ABC-type transport system involved in multi-copper enzyme maturation permease subunit